MRWRRNSGENRGKDTEKKQHVPSLFSLFFEEHKHRKGPFAEKGGFTSGSMRG